MPVDVIKVIQERFPQHVIAAHRYRGQATVVVERGALRDIASFLRDDSAMAFNFLMDLSCVDYLKFGKFQSNAPTLATPSPLPYYMKPTPTTETWQRLPAAPGLAQIVATQAGLISNDEYRFDVVYHFYSSTHNHRVRLKVPLTEADPVVCSLTELWASANWFEREVWDMFGVHFSGHPNLKRILMYEAFKGHPLRKDYPIRKRQPLVGPIN